MMVPLLRRHLVIKVGLMVLVAVVLGFGLSTVLSTRIQVASLEQLHQVSAASLARSLNASIRHTMLAGNGLVVRQLLVDAKDGIGDAEVRIYAPDGEEVFAEKPPAPAFDTLPAHIQNALNTSEATQASKTITTVRVENQDRCRSCHAEGDLRGVLSVSTHGAKVKVDDAGHLAKAVGEIVREGFVQIMTGEHEDKLDDYFSELAQRTPGVRAVSVYTADAEHYFGSESMIVPPEVIARSFKPGPAFAVGGESESTLAIPLPNEPRCQGCHDEGPDMRGALFVSFAPEELRGEASLLSATRASLEYVMLSGLGRLVNHFLDRVGSTGTVSALTLHDAEGRLYHDAFDEPSPPAAVRRALQQGQTVVMGDMGGLENSEYIHVEPLVNERRCQTCHGTDRPLRGAIEIRLDTTAALRAREELVRESAITAGVTILFVFVLLYLGLRFAVLRPVQRIGEVADLVGEGHFDVHVDVQTLDEIGRLGGRINSMITGLRQKLALSKFVSEGTLRTVDATDGAVRRGGERRRMAIVFSDIRGFTAYSEAREPEEVVEMLNRNLQAQAVVVKRHGGDIDKFVGDELMARFDGVDMEIRAVRCAVEMVEAVEALNREKGSNEHPIHVGVGVNVGEVVLGAMGSEDRMDYTVIGDAVNLGARLCSAAPPGDVLVSEPIRTSCSAMEDVIFTSLEPIQVKGKQDPISIYLAGRKTS